MASAQALVAGQSAFGKLAGMGRFRSVELDDLELAGPRLVLRRWRAEDAARVHAVMQEPSMRAFLALPSPYTPTDAAQFVNGIGHEGRADGTGLSCAVVERSTGRVVGSAALRLGADPEIGYWVAPDAQGERYAAEATGVMADWAFGTGVPRIGLACDVRNLASVRTALGAGFQFEGVARAGLLGGGRDGVPERRADLARFARLAGDPPDRVRYAFAPMPAGGLDDGVLRLRTMRPEDGTALAETDDELTLRWSFAGEPHTVGQARQEAERAGLQWLVGPVAAFALVDAATEGFAGALRLRTPGPPQVAGIGYVVHPAYRGRGYATRALRLLVPWAFDVADLARLELGAKVGNEASLRAAAAAGFVPDGARKRRLRNADGSFSDEIRYALNNPRYT